MRNRISLIVISIFLFLMVFLPACQPTPEKQPVVNKGELEQTIIEKTVETPKPAQTQAEPEATSNAKKTEAAFTWKDEYIDEKGIFKVKIDADVIMPDAASFPAVSMELSQFSDEQLSNVVNTFFDSSPIYDGNIPPTKSELAEEIIKVKAEQQDPNVKIDRNYLKYLEDAYESAYDNVEFKEIEPVWKDSYGINRASLMQLRNDGERIHIYGTSSEKERCYIEYSSSGAYVPAGKLSGTLNGVSMTLGEAERAVTDTVEQLGLKDYKIVSEAAGGLLEISPNMDPRNPSKDNQCYIFYLSNTICGIPFTYVQKAEGEFMTDEKPYAPPVFQETIEVHVNDNGVVYFRWDNPYEQAEYVSDNVELLDFEEIKGIFLDQMKRVGQGRNEWYPSNGKTDDTINIDKVELGMMVTIDKDAPNHKYPCMGFLCV